MNKFFIMYANFFALLVFFVGYAEQFYYGVTGDTWWNLRLTDQAHVAIVAEIMVTGIILLALHLRHPFSSLKKGIVGSLASLILFLMLANNIWWLAESIYTNNWGVTFLQIIFPACLVFSFLVLGRPYWRIVKKCLAALIPMSAYLVFWAIMGFRITIVNLVGTHTIYYNDFWTNLTEIGFWLTCCVAWILVEYLND